MKTSPIIIISRHEGGLVRGEMRSLGSVAIYWVHTIETLLQLPPFAREEHYIDCNRPCIYSRAPCTAYVKPNPVINPVIHRHYVDIPMPSPEGRQWWGLWGATPVALPTSWKNFSISSFFKKKNFVMFCNFIFAIYISSRLQYICIQLHTYIILISISMVHFYICAENQ